MTALVPFGLTPEQVAAGEADPRKSLVRLFEDYKPEPWHDFPGMIRALLEKGYARSECLPHCPDHGGREHAHLRDDRDGFLVWADGTWSAYDLTQPARGLIPRHVPRRG